MFLWLRWMDSLRVDRVSAMIWPPGLSGGFSMGVRCWFGLRVGLVSVLFIYGEFDPGSGRTLAACLTHASRTVMPLRGLISGERVSNT